MVPAPASSAATATTVAAVPASSTVRSAAAPWRQRLRGRASGGVARGSVSSRGTSPTLPRLSKRSSLELGLGGGHPLSHRVSSRCLLLLRSKVLRRRLLRACTVALKLLTMLLSCLARTMRLLSLVLRLVLRRLLRLVLVLLVLLVLLLLLLLRDLANVLWLWMLKQLLLLLLLALHWSLIIRDQASVRSLHFSNRSGHQQKPASHHAPPCVQRLLYILRLG
mmetsp:Transcript_13303/g.49398  ORF Transcript_13303/g.49398 Transcript_13303/m.49398 type:complete len:222 (+) Transcript_13303:498-1163(+)